MTGRTSPRVYLRVIRAADSIDLSMPGQQLSKQTRFVVQIRYGLDDQGTTCAE